MTEATHPDSVITLAGKLGTMKQRDLRPLLFGLGSATAMQFYSFDSINLILMDMAGAFGASRDEASWILTIYTSALFVGTPASVYLARRFGIFHYLIGSILLFLCAAIGCALSSDLGMMLVFRAIQGFAGAGLNFWWRGSVYFLLPPAHRSKSMMHISVMLYGATSIGLLLSGFLADAASWRWVWMIDALLAAVAIALLLRYFPRLTAEPERRQAPIDGLGMALLAVALIAIQIILSRGNIDDWFGSTRLVALAWFAILALALFAYHELRPGKAVPLLHLALMKDRNVLAAVCLGVLTGIILGGAIYALPEYLRGVDPQRRSALQTGEVMCAYAITAACVRPMVTKAIGRFGQRKVAAFALLSLIASMLLMAHFVTTGTPAYYYILPLILYGFCLSPLLSAIGSGTAAKLARPQQIDAVSIYLTFRQFGTSLGVALVSILIEWRETLHSSRLLEHIHRGRQPVDAWLADVSHVAVNRAGMTSDGGARAALRLLKEVAGTQASTLAFADTFRCMSLVGIVALAVVPLMSPTVRKS